jgi:hypothetical protein
VNNLTRLYNGAVHAVIMLGLGMLGFVTAACDSSPGSVSLVTTASSFTPAAEFSPNPIRLVPFGGARCPGGSFFGTTFRLIITAGVRDLTLDSVTLRMIDGSNLGGPSVTIPSLELGERFGSTFIRAGTTRAFGMNPSFDCVAIRPRSLRANVFLFDGFGMRQTLVLESSIQ